MIKWVKEHWPILPFIGFALLFTVLTLSLVFRDVRYAIITNLPVGFTVMMKWLAMD